MDNSLAANRRLAVQVVLAQAAAAILIGLPFLAGGEVSALGALGGALVVTAGTGVLAFRVFAPPVAPANVMLLRFALGTLVKWLVVLGGLFVMLAHLRMPLLPVLAGVGAAMLVNWLVLRFNI